MRNTDGNTFYSFCLRFLFVLLVLSLMNFPPVYGQMVYGAQWSDVWVVADGSDAHNDETLGSNYPGIRIKGCGVTEDSYNSYGHQYWVITTLRSPNGRTASVTSYTSSSYARADVSLRLQVGDEGNYVIETWHWLNCPFAGSSFPTGSTGGSQLFAIKRSGYAFAGEENNRCLWTKTCNGKCSVDRHTTNKNSMGTCFTGMSGYKQCYDLVIDDECSVHRVVCNGQSFQPACDS